MPTMKQAAGAVIIVMILQIIALKFSLYFWWPSLDIPMHLLGGLAMGLVAQAWWARDIANVSFTKDSWLSAPWFRLCVTIGFVAVIGIGWEWFEFLMDHVGDITSHIGLAQTSVADTMGDLFFDLLGGAIAFGLMYFTPKK